MTAPPSVILYDSRIWDSAQDPFAFPALDGRLQNIGSGTTPGVTEGGIDWDFDLQLQTAGFAPAFAEHEDFQTPSSGGTWSMIGGTPSAEPWTIAIGIGTLTIASFGSAKATWVVMHDGDTFSPGVPNGATNPGIGFYVENDEFDGFVLNVLDPDPTATYELAFTHTDPAMVQDVMAFIEYTYPGDVPTINVWLDGSVIHTATATAYTGSDVDTAIATFINAASWFGFGVNPPASAGDPWDMIGFAVIRDTLDDAVREEWREYFFGPLPETPVTELPLPFEYMDRWQNMQEDPDWWERAEQRDVELEDYLAGLAAQVAALTAIVEAL
jgi:hypothetical protein